jgi:outer membrane lipoprotein-sorting protein
MSIARRSSVCLLLLVSTTAFAGAKEEVKAAMQKFAAAKSYHATMVHSGTKAMTNEIDFAAPDRMRMKMPMGTQVIIGDTMYMQVSGEGMDGRVMKVPMPKGTLTQWRDPARMAGNEATLVVQALGSELLDGKPARKYLTRDTKTPGESTLWIGANGYPLQVRVDSRLDGKPVSTTIRYSRINDPSIRVDPPK